jgi:hypothetical protein
LPDPGSADALLGSLRRFFLLRYNEHVKRNYPAFRGVFPLTEGSRLDLVRINGGDRVHFLYARGESAEHLVVIHDLTLSGRDGDAGEERRFVRWALGIESTLAHFIVEPPFEDQFERVEEEALAAVRRQSNTPIGSLPSGN